jgi:hypothetical protein
VCWLPPNGTGGFCWPALEAGRALPGPAPAGVDCLDGVECRSGVCEQGRCVDACCDDSYCSQGADICRVKPTPLVNHEIWACGAPPGGTPTSDCNDDNDCPTGRCEQVTIDARICIEPCCSSSECGELPGPLGVQALVCRPLDGTLRACAEAVDLGLNPRGVGAACTSAVQCRSGLCDPAGYCTDYCCDDASCGDTTRFSCQPVSEGSNWALRCVAK